MIIFLKDYNIGLEDIPENILEVTKDIFPERSVEIMTLAERLINEGKEKGRQEAMALAERLISESMEKGMEKAKMETAKKLLRMGLSSEQVSEATELPLQDILELKKEMEN